MSVVGEHGDHGPSREETATLMRQVLAELDLPRHRLFAKYLNLMFKDNPKGLKELNGRISLTNSGLSRAIRREIEDDTQGLKEPVVRMSRLEIQTASPRPGDHFGSFIIEKELAKGGMGQVFLARHREQKKLKAALKIIRPEMENPTNIARFKRELDLLTSLDHPNIAKVLDSGTAINGSPWLAMNYVSGQALHVYCRDHKLPLRRRLILFLKIVDAVAYAHRKLVLHRDLKPTNILVDEHGEPHLLDFGIAALLESDTGGHLTVDTQGSRVFTPEYAAPEQYRGDRLTTSADIFCIGVLLYLLVNDSLPPRDQKDGAVLLDFKETEGSTASKPTKDFLKPRTTTDRDLDAVIRKCLRSDPRRRYASAQQLAEDLERYLDGLPVSAGGFSRWNAIRKFAVRNRVLVGSFALFFLTLLISLAGFMVQNRIISREKEAAEMERRVAVEVTDFLVDTFNVTDPVKGGSGQISAAELLERGYETISWRFPEPSYVKARLLYTQGKVHLNMGNTEKAYHMLSEALTCMETVAASKREQLRTRVDLATVLARHNPSQLEPFAEQTFKEFQQPEFNDLRGELYNILGVFFYNTGNVEKGADAMDQGLLLRRQVLGDDAEALVPSLFNLAFIKFNFRNDPGGALLLLEDAVRIQKIHNPDHPRLVFHLNLLARILSSQGEFTEAEKIFEDAVSRAERQMGFHDSRTFVAYMGFAESLIDQGEDARALAILEKLKESQIKNLNLANPNVITMLSRQAEYFAKLERFDQQESIYSEMLRRCRADQRVLPQDYAYTCSLKGRFHFDRKQYKQARRHFQEGLGVWREAGKTEDPQYGRDLLDASQNEIAMEEWSLLNSYLNQARDMFKALGDPFLEDYFRSLHLSGTAGMKQARYKDAEAHFLECWTLYERMDRDRRAGLPSEWVQGCLEGLTDLYDHLGDADRARHFKGLAAGIHEVQ